MVEAFAYVRITTSFGVCRPAHLDRPGLRGVMVLQYTRHLTTSSLRRNENNDLVLMIVGSRGSDWRWALLSGHNAVHIRGKGLLQDEYETWFERGSLQTLCVGTALQRFLMSSLRQAVLRADIYNYSPYSCKVT